MRHHILLVILFWALSTAAPASTDSAFPKLCAELDLAVISDIETSCQRATNSGT